LSERLLVETMYEGARWSLEFAHGRRVGRLRRIGASSTEGTTIRFRPDPQIFACTELDAETVRARLQELAWLNPQLRVWFQEQRLRGRSGILGWARQLAAPRGRIQRAKWLTQNIVDVRVDIALVWNRSGAPIVKAFVNMQPTIDSGSHVDALWLGFAHYARMMKSPARRIEHVREAIGCGLVAIVHVGLYAPEFANPTRDLLKSPRAAEAVCAAIQTCLDPEQWYSWDLRRFIDKRLHVNSRYLVRSASRWTSWGIRRVDKRPPVDIK
jgi:DNA gyrase subunit B